MSNKKGSISARSAEYWIHKGYSESDAVIMARSRMPGTIEYYEIYKKVAPADAKMASIEWQKRKANTKKNMISKYGVDEGSIRWESYCNKHRVKNTFDEKRRKFGWTEREFKEYNTSRAVTKKNMIRRHGSTAGSQLWQEYVDRQRYTITLDYFISEYGVEVGTAKFDRFSRLRKHTLESYLERFDGDLAKASAALNAVYTTSRPNTYKSSNVCREFCSALHDSLLSYGEYEVYYENFNMEYYFGLPGYGLVYVDFYCKTTNKVVEFFGDYWHGNPKIYNASDVIKFPHNTSIVAGDLWGADHKRITHLLAKARGVRIIWESDYHSNPTDHITNITKWIIDEN